MEIFDWYRTTSWIVESIDSLRGEQGEYCEIEHDDEDDGHKRSHPAGDVEVALTIVDGAEGKKPRFIVGSIHIAVWLDLELRRTSTWKSVQKKQSFSSSKL